MVGYTQETHAWLATHKRRAHNSGRSNQNIAHALADVGQSPGVDSWAAMLSTAGKVYTPNIRGDIRNSVR
eukprot:1185905-Prorocentrum_minimum.AAC.2